VDIERQTALTRRRYNRFAPMYDVIERFIVKLIHAQASA
jgi:hypothetical protein